MSAFGPIQTTPFGTRGEVFLVPDPSTRVTVPFAGGTTEYFMLGDFRTLDGTPWNFCPRQVLRRALERLESETGLRLLAAFEQEFTYSGVAAHPAQPYELDAYRRQGAFGETLNCTDLLHPLCQSAAVSGRCRHKLAHGAHPPAPREGGGGD